MSKSTAEMLKALENRYDLSQDELEVLVAAFQLHKSEEAAGQIERPTRLH